MAPPRLQQKVPGDLGGSGRCSSHRRALPPSSSKRGFVVIGKGLGTRKYPIIIPTAFRQASFRPLPPELRPLPPEHARMMPGPIPDDAPNMPG